MASSPLRVSRRSSRASVTDHGTSLNNSSTQLTSPHLRNLFTYLLAVSPAGQLSVVLEICQVVLEDAFTNGDSACSQTDVFEFLTALCKAHCEACCVPLSIESRGREDTAVVSKFCKLAEDDVDLIAPALDSYLRIDYSRTWGPHYSAVSLPIESASGAALKVKNLALLPAKDHKFRAAIEAELREHIFKKATYTVAPSSRSGLAVLLASAENSVSPLAAELLGVSEKTPDIFRPSEGLQRIQILICVEDANLSSLSGTSWRSFWEITFCPGDDGPAQLLGSVRVSLHARDVATVNLTQKRNFTLEVSGDNKNPTHLAKALVELIDKAERRVVQGIDECLNSLGGRILRCVRRVLPFSGEKFDWATASARISLRADVAKQAARMALSGEGGSRRAGV